MYLLLIGTTVLSNFLIQLHFFSWVELKSAKEAPKKLKPMHHLQINLSPFTNHLQSILSLQSHHYLWYYKKYTFEACSYFLWSSVHQGRVIFLRHVHGRAAFERLGFPTNRAVARPISGSRSHQS